MVSKSTWMPVLMSASSSVLTNQSNMRGILIHSRPSTRSPPVPLNWIRLVMLSSVGLEGITSGGSFTVAEAGVMAVTKSQ